MITLSTMITDLIAAGYTEAQLANATGTTQATINRVKLGRTADPAYSVGVEIEKLWRKKSKRRKAA